MSDAPAPTRAEEGREIIAELERELGVTGTANVFRKALAIAKEAAAIARVRQETYAADQLVERLRSWGENDADPEFFTGDLLSGVLMDCGMGGEAIVAANLRAAQAEAEVARLSAALKVSDKKAREVMLACLRAFRTSVMNDNALPFSAFCTLVDDRMCEAARTALEAPHADN